mgnify:CR=1 FL=1
MLELKKKIAEVNARWADAASKQDFGALAACYTSDARILSAECRTRPWQAPDVEAGQYVSGRTMNWLKARNSTFERR